MEVPELIDDPRFARGFPRYTNRAELEPLLEKAFSARPSTYWLERLREADVPASLVNDYAEMVLEPQVAANDYIVEQDHPRFGRQRVIGLHIQLSDTPGELGSPAPLLGEHTADVLAAAGYDTATIAALEQSGVISVASSLPDNSGSRP